MPIANLTDVACRFDLRGAGPPLLMIAGLGKTSRWWTGLEILERDFTLILPDNRGVAESKAKRQPERLRDYAVDMIELLDHLGVEQANVLGLSLGGMIARRMALDHPSRVRRLVLISTTDHFTPYLRFVAKLLKLAARSLPAEVFELMLAVLGSGPEPVDADPGRIEAEIHESMKDPSRPGAAMLRQIACIEADAALDHEPTLEVPTLVIAGGNDRIIPCNYARTMAQGMPHARFVLIPEAGHNPLRECGERVFPLIQSFLLADDADAAASLGEFTPIPALAAWAH